MHLARATTMHVVEQIKGCARMRGRLATVSASSHEGGHGHEMGPRVQGMSPFWDTRYGALIGTSSPSAVIVPRAWVPVVLGWCLWKAWLKSQVKHGL